MNKLKNRFQVLRFRGESLEENPLNSPIEREIHVYLPPDYYKESVNRYPVIYCFHGYTGNSNNLNIYPRWNDNKNLPIDQIPADLLNLIETDKLASYEKLDELIKKKGWNPFILVQPDVSLYLPHYLGTKELTGLVKTKGSFYINSPHTGNYLDYIIKDVIKFVDDNFRTIPDKSSRGIVGTSMGGYGALFVALHHPEAFSSVVALAPANLNLDSLEWEMITPLIALMYGEEKAKEMGAQGLHDIHNTCDLIFSKENPLLPSIRKDANGKIIRINEKAVKNWIKYDIKTIIKENPDALKSVNLLINCHKKDQYGLAMECRKIHKTLLECEIKHDFKIYVDARANVDPHTLGIGYKTLPALEFCNIHFN